VRPAPPPRLTLPRVVAAAQCGSTIVAVVDAKPPMLVSHDAGTTWRDSGRGLPAGRAVAIDDLDPDIVVYATRNRLHLSRNGGRARRGVLGDAEIAEERARLPAAAVAREAVGAGARDPAERREVGRECGDLLGRAELDVDMRGAEVVLLDRQPRPADAECGEQ